MSENKLKSKRKWVQNAIAELKPFIERKEHITRSTAGKLLKPVTNWQRREVDTLRKQANQIIRGENVNAMVYTIFGMTLEHPELKPVKEMFDASVKAEREPYVLSGNLKIRGVMPSEHDVFHTSDGKTRDVYGGDVWIIRNGDGSTDTMVIENDQTYVLIKDTLKFPPAASIGYRCIYPECVVVSEIELVEAVQPDEPVEAPLPPPSELVLCTKTYALSKEKENGDCYLDDDGCLKAWTGNSWLNLGVVNLPGPARNGLIILNWVKNIETMADLPDNPEPGDMVGVYNGRHFDPDVYMVWTVQQQWCELVRNEGNEEEIRAAQMRTLGQRFGVLMEEKIVSDFKQTFANHRNNCPTTSKETTAPVKRINPRYTLLVANEYDTERLNEKAACYRTNGYLEDLDDRSYVWQNGRWVLYSSIVEMENDKSLHHGESSLYSEYVPTPDVYLAFAPEETLKHTTIDNLRHGDAYINGSDHVIAWMNNEWVDLGPFNHGFGYIRRDNGDVEAKKNRDLLEEHLQCKVKYKAIVHSWAELPESPAKGDMYTRFDYSGVSQYPEVVWDGETWIDHCYPFKPIAIPEYVVETELMRVEETLVKENQGNVTDWRFEEPKPNPNSFWSRVGRVLGFK